LTRSAVATLRRDRPVLHCIWTLGSGGAERQISYLAPELARLGWNIHVAFAFGGKHKDSLQRSAVTLHDLAGRRPVDLAVPLRLTRLIRALRPGIIQTWLTQMDLIGGSAALASRIPWILSERSSTAAYSPSALHSCRMFLGKRASLVIANSEGGVEYWRRLRPSGNAIIPNALPLESIASADLAGVPAHARGAVLFVGRLSVEKNPSVLLTALALPGMERFHAVVCGAGPLAAELARHVHAAGLEERVLMAGEVENTWAYMRNAGALVAPSVFEGNPNAVLEAACCGTPLVVSDIPAHRRIFRSGSAVFVDPSDAGSVAEGIRNAFTSAAVERVTSAREDVAAFDVTSMALRYDQAYKALSL
jgi:glycosyltransferase involved in cell wall biosynthesis